MSIQLGIFVFFMSRRTKKEYGLSASVTRRPLTSARPGRHSAHSAIYAVLQRHHDLANTGAAHLIFHITGESLISLNACRMERLMNRTEEGEL